MQLNALFCCLWHNVEVSCHKHFVVLSRDQHRRLLPATCHNLRALTVVHRRPCWQHMACCSVNSRQSSHFCLPYLHSTPPLGLGSRRNIAMPFGTEKVELSGKNRDCGRISGLSLLVYQCRQHSHGMRPIVSIDDAWYTNVAYTTHEWSGVCRRWYYRNAQKCHFAYTRLYWALPAPKVDKTHQWQICTIIQISPRSVPPSPRYV